MKARNKINCMDIVVMKHIDNTNRKLSRLDNSSKKLFGAVKKAVDAFGTDKKALSIYRKGLQTNHRSTISIMIRVAKNEVIRKYEAKLPTSYQTLNELIKLINELERIEDTSFFSLIRKGEVHTGMTKSDVLKLRKNIEKRNSALTYKTAEYDESSIVKIASVNEKVPVKIPKLEELEDFVSNLDEARRKKLIELLQEKKDVTKEAA